MHIVIVSTYPPRKCGIATFSRDLRDAMLSAEPDTVVELVASLQPDADSEEQRGEVVETFWQEDGDYAELAERINRIGPDAVIIEHEYGIYGGEDGQEVLTLAGALQVPFAVTLHTVLSEPSPHQAEILEKLCGLATWVVCMSPRARQFLVEDRKVAESKVHIVGHGAPQALVAGQGLGPDEQLEELRAMDLDVDGRTLLSTFGLISPGKGLELAIRALPGIVASHPEVLYVVAGRTHPEIVKRHGEAYREGLEELARELGVEDNIAFANGYLSDEQLQSVLGRTQIFVTPYRSREQIVSGALTFAVAAGCAVVSTPYYYAEDIVGAGTGWLVPFEDADALAKAVVHALDNPDELEQAHQAAHKLGQSLAWPIIGQRVLDLLRDTEADALANGQDAADALLQE